MIGKSASRKLPREEAIMLLREAQADNNTLRAENERLRQDYRIQAEAAIELRAINEWLRQELATCHNAALEGAIAVCPSGYEKELIRALKRGDNG